MSIHIKNNCAKRYRPNPEKTVTKIISKVPAEFLEGLTTIEIYDHGKKEYPTARYIKSFDSKKHSKIELYMDSKSLTGAPFFSILEQNIHILNAINNHIENSIKVKNSDQNIINYPTNKMNSAWVYIGVWQPFLIIFRATTFLIDKLSFVYKLYSMIVNFILKKTKKR